MAAGAAPANTRTTRSAEVRAPASRRALIGLAVALSYALASQTTQAWFNGSGPGATFFPAAGITVAALILCDRRTWPYILVAAGSAEIVMDRLHGIELDASLGYALANVAEPLVGATLVLWFAGRPALSRPGDLAAFVGFAVVVAPAIGGAIGATNAVVIGGETDWATFAGQWWIGDGLGVLVVGGSIVAVARTPPTWTGFVAALKAIAAPAAVVAVTVLMFATDTAQLGIAAIAGFLVVALRQGTTTAAVTGALMAFAAAEAVATGHSFLDTLAVTPETGLVYVQLVLGLTILTGLALAAEIHERESAMVEAGRSEAAARQSAFEAVRATALAQLTGQLASLNEEGPAARALLAHGLPVAGAAAGGVYLGAGDEVERIAASGDLGLATTLSLSAGGPVADAIKAGARPGAPGSRLAEIVSDAGGRAALGFELSDGRKGAVVVAGATVAKQLRDSVMRALVDRFTAALERIVLRRLEVEAQARTATLQELAEEVALAESPQRIAEVVVERSAVAHGAEYGFLAIAESESTTPAVVAARGVDPPRWEPGDSDARTPAREVLRTGKVAWFESRAEAQAKFPDVDLESVPVEAAFAVPLRVDDRLVGVLAWGFREPREFDQRFRALTSAIASQYAIALDRARLAAVKRRYADELQQQMLPQSWEVPASVEVAAGYVASEYGLEVGGDWYDVFAIDDARIGIVIGDVVGRGLEASLATGQLRHATVALADGRRGPAALLARLEAFADRFEAARCSTVWYAELDLHTGVLRYSAAGHPPAVLYRGGAAQLLMGGRGVPLCVAPELERDEAHETLAPGDVLLLYTDGLIERRGQGFTAALKRLREFDLEGVGGGSSALTEAVLREIYDPTSEDDAAVLAVSVRSLPVAGVDADTAADQGLPTAAGGIP